MNILYSTDWTSLY